jgi:hypothetical protein
MTLLSATLGRVAPRYRLLREWTTVYDQIIAARPLVAHTLRNHRIHIRCILEALGDMALHSIRPHHIACLIRDVHARWPNKARKVLLEARRMLDEAVGYGWIDRNPASGIKPLRTPVMRQRLSLEQWQAMHDLARTHHVPWVAHLLELALVTGHRRQAMTDQYNDDRGLSRGQWRVLALPK